MKRTMIFAVALALLAAADSSARPPNVSHGGGGRPSGGQPSVQRARPPSVSHGGGERPSIQHVPSFSMTAPRQQLPQVKAPVRISPNIVTGGRQPAFITGRNADPARNWNDQWNRRPYHAYHRDWHHGHWNSWGRIPGVWLGAAALGGWLLPPGRTIVYSNPYYVVPDTVYETPVPDYSNPIPVPDSGEEDASEEEPPREMQDFDSARAAFKKGDYASALNLVDRAIGQTPGDLAMHEFRALTLFALAMYRDAAAGVYAVLSAGPGWDWDTLQNLYPDTETYTRQLRALERYQRDNPSSAEARFLLAYHYLTLNQRDQAVKQLEQVTQLQPANALAAELLKALKTPAGAPPAGGQ